MRKREKKSEFAERKAKENGFLSFISFFALVTIAVAVFTMADKINSAGYAVIPMLFALIFSRLYKNSKRAIEENNE